MSFASQRVRYRITHLPFVLAAAACTAYAPDPPDLEAHLAAFRERARTAPESSAPRAFDLADGIDADEAELLALTFNRDLRRARLAAKVTLATAENAGRFSDPTLGVDLARILQSTPEPWKAFGSLGITLPLSGRLELERERAGLGHAATLTRVAAQEWSTRLTVRRVFAEWEAIATKRAESAAYAAQIDEVLGVVERMEQAGGMPRAEARLFRIEAANVAARRAALESNAVQLELELRERMGLHPDAPVAFVPGHAEPPPAPSFDGAAATAALRRHPEFQVALAEHASAEKQLELELRRQYPDLRIGPGLGREDGEDQVLLGLELPLPFLDGNRRAIAEAFASRDLARAQVEMTQEELLVRWRGAEQRLAAARRQHLALASSILPLVEAQYADARHLAQLGEVNTLVLLESLKRRQDAELQRIDLLLAEARAAIDLHELVGCPAEAAATAATPPGSAAE